MAIDKDFLTLGIVLGIVIISSGVALGLGLGLLYLFGVQI